MNMSFTLPQLRYGYKDLEPHIDSTTMEIHHAHHHNTYVSNLNKALTDTDWINKNIEDLMAVISKLPAEVRNNGGGHYNHSLFWQVMAPQGGGAPTGDLNAAIIRDFGSFDAMKEKFNDTALTCFGSGWAWLIVKNNGKLDITSSANQDNPLMDTAEIQGTPILGLDVWEHAYYLKYQNKRPDYIHAWWNVVNWAQANKNFAAAKK
jgi:Fe-Mn family superoxide dismutase